MPRLSVITNIVLTNKDIKDIISYIVITLINFLGGIMMNNNTLKITIIGKVAGNYLNTDDNGNKTRNIPLEIDQKTADWFDNLITAQGFTWSGDSYPIVQEEDGRIIFKTHSKFDIQTKNLPSGFTLDELGKGSEVKTYVTVKNGRYGRKSFVSAYLVAIECYDFIELEEYDAFSDNDFADCPFEHGEADSE